MDLVSIVVPVYNVEKYLHRCIDSLSNQTYRNIEIIIINDGSSDSSLSIAEECAAIDKRIYIYSQQNGGLSAARNAGIEYANGKYITFIDSDDWVSYDYIENLLYPLTNEDCSFSMTLPIISYDGKLSKDNEVDCAGYRLISRKSFSEKSLSSNLFISAWGKLYLKRIFNEYRFPIGKLHEDIYFMSEYLDDIKNVAIVDKRMYYYFQRSGSITGDRFSEKKLQLIDATNQYTKSVLSLYPELAIMAQAYKNHAWSSVVKQMKRKDLIEHRELIRDLIISSRHSLINIIKSKEVSCLEKSVTMISSSNPLILILTWSIYDRIFRSIR